MDSALPATPWVILNFMIPPTRVDRLLATPYQHTCPTISSFFTVIYTAFKCPIHSFEFPYDIPVHHRAELIQYTNEYADLSIKCWPA